MKIVIDSRERHPLSFSRWPDVVVEVGGLHVGDYSLKGLETRFAVERKSVPDLVASVTRERERFERELTTLRGFDLAAIVVEGTMQEVANGEYRSRANPDSVLQTLAAFQVRYGVPTIWAGAPAGCAYSVRALARHFLRHAERTAQTIIKAHEEALQHV